MPVRPACTSTTASAIPERATPVTSKPADVSSSNSVILNTPAPSSLRVYSLASALAVYTAPANPPSPEERSVPAAIEVTAWAAV